MTRNNNPYRHVDHTRSRQARRETNSRTLQRQIKAQQTGRA